MRKVSTGSGAIAVQVVFSEKQGAKKMQHVGSAHSPAELALLEARARVVAGVVESVSLRWSQGFCVIDGVDFDASEFFFACFPGRGLSSPRRYQIWDEARTVALTRSFSGSGLSAWDTLTWFNPEVESYRRSPEFFREGRFDAAHMVEGYLDECMWNLLDSRAPLEWDWVVAQWPRISGDGADRARTLVLDDGRFQLTHTDSGEVCSLT